MVMQDCQISVMCRDHHIGTISEKRFGMASPSSVNSFVFALCYGKNNKKYYQGAIISITDV